MRILIIGSGGREHAFGWALAQSPLASHLFFCPGNPGTASLGPSIPVSPADFPGLADAAANLRVDLTVVGPEAPLAGGIVDVFTGRGLWIVGPTAAAARLESSKSFAKEIMRAASVPTAPWQVFDDHEAATAHVRHAGRPLVVKADGLAAGKGVTVCETPEAAARAVTRAMTDQIFGAAGRRVVIEEVLRGDEVSVLALTDGRVVLPLIPARDHKRLRDEDQGPNTGGMGAVAPVPLDAATEAETTAILQRVVDELQRRGTPYRGILYAGLMLTDDGPRVLEFNCRFGDPEAQVILPLLEGDLARLLVATARGGLDRVEVRWSRDVAVGIVLAADGYPEGPRLGDPITGLDEIDPEVLVFHSGTAWRPAPDRRQASPTVGERLVTAGGRVLTVVGRGRTVDRARGRALRAAETIRFEGKHFRRDIAARVAQVPVPVAESAVRA